MRLSYSGRAPDDGGGPNMKPGRAGAEEGAGVPPAIECISAVSLATHDMARAVRFYQALGFIESKDGKITRFDLVGKGSRVAGNSLRPYPVAFAFALADENHVAFRIPPYPVLAHSEAIYLRG